MKETKRTFKNERTFKVDTNHLGKAGEYRVASELVLRNHTIYLPLVDDGVDMIIDSNIKIQIKCGQRQILHDKRHNNDVIVYRYSFHSPAYKDKIHIKPHKLESVDFVICWAIEDNDFFIIPADKIRGKVGIMFTAKENKRTQAKWNIWHKYNGAWGLLNGERIEDIKPIDELECKNCGHKWHPLALNPSRCPNCNKRWDNKMYDHFCNRCGHGWHSKLEKPIWCPKCNSRVWDKERLPKVDYAPITCVRCGHTWIRQVEKPQRCPACHVIRYLGKRPTPYHIKCLRCGYEWDSTKEKPTQCGKCHTRKWDKPREETRELVLV